MKKYTIVLAILLGFVAINAIITLLIMSQLQKPLDKESQRIIEETVDGFLKNKIFEIVWKDYFYLFTHFESVDGYARTVSGAGPAAAMAGGIVELTTSTTAGNYINLNKPGVANGIARFDRDQRFRSTFVIDSVASIEGFVGMGEFSYTPTAYYYGFKITNDALTAIVCNGTSITESGTIKTLSINTYNRVEARLTYGNKILFLVDGVEKAVINTNIPTQGNYGTAIMGTFSNHYVKTNEAVNKTMRIWDFEFIQKK